MQELYVVKKGAINCEAILKDGVSPHTGKTKSEFIKEGFLVLPWEEMSKVLEENENKTLLGEWEEITDDEYWDFLECMPPLKLERDELLTSFFICEAETSNIHRLVVNYFDKKFYMASRRLTIDRGLVNLEIIKLAKERN